jgi:hypothetical protein
MVYTYKSASNSPSDLHANRIPIRFSVRFPILHQFTPIPEIVDEFNFLGSIKLRETLTAWATGRHGIGQRIGFGIGCVRVDAHFFKSDRESYIYPICMKSDAESDRESDAKTYV